MANYVISFKNGPEIPVFTVFTNKLVADLSYKRYVQAGAVDRELMQIYFPPDTDFEMLRAYYKSEDALSEITITDTLTGNFWVHLNYTLNISLRYENIKNETDIEKYEASEWIVMELAQLTASDKELCKLVGKATFDKSCMNVDEYKDYLISKSKTDLANYLETHLMEFNGENFKVTQEKQNLFMTTYTSCLARAAAEDDVRIIWNASGVVDDQERTNDWCVEFMAAISNFVNPLVTTQRTFESNVRACTTKQELDVLELPFV